MNITRKKITKTPKSVKLNLIISLFLFFITIFYFLFYNPATNFKTAYIEKSNEKYIITVKGKRNLMVHDPISLLKKGTYIDSAKYVISRPYGIIKGKELPNGPDSYPTINNNAITIKGNSLKINLIYYNFDDKANKSSVWNGNYKLVKRNF